MIDAARAIDVASLDALFRPSAVAVIGASADPNKIGGRPLQFLRRVGFAGAIYPINPAGGELQGIKAYRDIDQTPGMIDAAVIAVGARSVPAALEAAIDRGAKAVIVFSAGFAETDDEGRVLQAEVVARARAAGVRMLGPNSLGLFSLRSGFFGTFSTALDHAWPTRGPVAMVSQSGAVGSYVYAMAHSQGVGFSHFIATGNEGDVDLADCISWLAHDRDTSVIAGYFEGCQDGKRLCAALESARRARKAVILLKAGASEAGARAAASHTGSLAGQNTVYDAVFAEYNVHRAHSMEELLDVTYAAAAGMWPSKGCVGVITPSGGAGIVLADAAASCGLDLPEMPQMAQARIRSIVPYAGTSNPVDTTAQILNDFSLYGRVLDVMVEEGGYDILVAFLAHIGKNPAHIAKLGDALFAVRERNPERLFVACLLADGRLREELEQRGFLVFEDPKRAIGAAKALLQISQGFGASSVRPVPDLAMPVLPHARLNEIEAKQLLERAGIPAVAERVATTRDAAVEAADQLGYPVAMKILSAAISHKSEIGGVRLGLQSAAQVADAFDDMMKRVLAVVAEDDVGGVLLSPMLTGGVETILGVQRDPVFGPVVMFGLGGIFVETFKDVALRVAPFDERAALAMMRATRGFSLLDGARGRPKCDVQAVARALSRLSRFAEQNAEAFESIDINPFVVFPDGAVALDALIVPRQSPEGGHRAEPA
jgi:acyl-CoA synthetase (NDP forming)